MSRQRKLSPKYQKIKLEDFSKNKTMDKTLFIRSHFKSSFYANFLVPVKNEPKLKVQKKLQVKFLYDKAGYKMLVEMTPADISVISFANDEVTN